MGELGKRLSRGLLVRGTLGDFFGHGLTQRGYFLEGLGLSHELVVDFGVVSFFTEV